MNTTHRRLRLFQTGLCLSLIWAGAWAAINRGAIRGTVTDPQGAVVPEVKVVVMNRDTGVAQTVVTNNAGFYLVPELVPGPYKVHLEKSGFVSAEFDMVTVKANDVATVDAQLGLGRTTQTVVVTATSPLVDTTASNFSTPVEQRYMQDLPILGRDIQGLAQLLPGVTQSNGPPGTLVGFEGQFGGFPDPTHIQGSLIAVNGSQAGANVWYLDGSLNSAEGADNVVVNPPPDAVSEFQSVTGAFGAEYGRTAGGVFNVVLKSGSNRLHGDLYEFNRNSLFHARNPFGGTDPVTGKPLPPNFVNWNQFGGTLGGPVVLPHLYNGKSRTFFFGAWDVSVLHEKAGAGIFTVPTLLMRRGDFSEFPSVSQFGLYDPMTTRYDSSLGYFVRDPFLNADGTLATKLPADRLDPVAVWFMNQFPAPNFLDPREQDASRGGCLNTCNNYRGSYGSAQTTHSGVAKVDHQISEKNKLFVEWLYNPTGYNFFNLPWKSATTPFIGFNGSFPFKVRNQMAALGNTVTFSPTLVNEFRLLYSRQEDIPVLPPNSLVNIGGELQQLSGLNLPFDPPFSPVPLFVVGWSTFWGPPVNKQHQTTDAFTIIDNITKVLSKHTLKTGFMFRDDRVGNIFNPDTYLFITNNTTTNPATYEGGHPFAQFMLGAVDQGSFRRAVASTYHTVHTWSAYVQDDYRVTPKLTLNLGLRYDVYEWYRERHNVASVFDPDHPNPSIPTRLGRLVYVGTPAHPDRVLYPAHHRDFAPRLNFAYSPFGDHKTVIRGGIDLIYTNGLTQNLGIGLGAAFNPGYDQYLTWVSDATNQGLEGSYVTPAFLLSKGAPSLPPYRDPKASDEQKLGPGGGFLTNVPNTHDPTQGLWNLQVERQFPGDMMVSVGYVGSRGVHLLSDTIRNLDYVPTKIRLQLRSKLNEFVPMPADLAPYFGSEYYASQLYLGWPQYPLIQNNFSMDASSTYHGFQLKLEKRYSHGLNFIVAYTAQKTIGTAGIGGYVPQTTTGGTGPYGGLSGRGRISQVGGYGGYLQGSNRYQDPDNRRGDRSLVPDDIPQIFNSALTYELPFGPGRLWGSQTRGARRMVVEGWKITGNFNAQRGIPLGIIGPCNALTCRVNLIGSPSQGRGQKTRDQLEKQWYKPNAFEAVFGSNPDIINIATTGTPTDWDQHDEFYRFGTAGLLLGNARSPGFWNLDLALAKDFRISEAKYAQLRLEVYNALNHQNLGLPSTSWCLPPNPDGSVDAVHQFGCQFGRIYNVQTDPRALQFGLKFVF